MIGPPKIFFVFLLSFGMQSPTCGIKFTSLAIFPFLGITLELHYCPNMTVNGDGLALLVFSGELIPGTSFAVFALGSKPGSVHPAQAAGGSFWSCTQGQQLSDDDPQNFCMCGKKFPSRAHLVWVCPATEGHRRGIPPPEDRVAERMFAKCTPSFPGPHITICPDGQVRELAAELCQVQPSVQSVFIAIDGSSKHHVGAWAISAQHRLSDFASCLTSEDQTPFRCEIEAFHILSIFFVCVCSVPTSQKGLSF